MKRQDVARHDARDELARDELVRPAVGAGVERARAPARQGPHGPHRRRAADRRSSRIATRRRSRRASAATSRSRTCRSSTASRRRWSSRTSTSTSRPACVGRARRSVGLGQVDAAQPPRRASTSRSPATSSTTASRSTTWTSARVRQQIGIVPQHPFIFGGTMRENIALAAPGATLDRIQHCGEGRVPARRHRRDADELRHRRSPTAAARSRVASASASRSPAPSSATRALMLLDEATSALDNSTEKKVIAEPRDACAARASPSRTACRPSATPTSSS